MKKKHQLTNMTQIVSLIIGMIAVITTRNLELFALDQQITPVSFDFEYLH